MNDDRRDENQRQGGAFNEGTSEAANSEASAKVAPSSMATQSETSEPNLQITDIQTTLNEDDRPTPQGPTGPRTECGKKLSSRNAIKFGIFSSAALLKGESRAEYERLWEGLRKSLKPRNELGEILVNQMASNLWRQRRVRIAECAEIRRNSEFIVFDRRQKELKEAEEISQKRQAGVVIVYASEPVGLIWTIENPEVVERCIEILVEMRQGIEANGFDKEQDVLLLKSIYGEPGVAHLRQTLQDEFLTWLNTAEVTEKERARERYATPEQCKQNVLRAIGVEIKRLKQYEKEHNSIESKRREVEILRQRVPDSPGLDRLLRYRNSFEREFDRLLTQFERTQRISNWQPPPQEDDSIS
jgi:hypothetical protein